MKIWKDEEVKSLFEDVEWCKNKNLPLRTAFLQHAQKFGRKCNSVRNYYYFEVDNLQNDAPRRQRLNVDLSQHQKTHFQNFDKQNEEELFEKIQTLMRSGLSARAACLQISGGDLQLLTRFQNKYQNMKRKLKNAQNFIAPQDKQGIQGIQDAQNNQNNSVNQSVYGGQGNYENQENRNNQVRQENSTIQRIAENSVQGVDVQNFDEIQPDALDNIIPFRSTKKSLSDADINSLFLGLVRLIKKNAQEEASVEKQSSANAILRKAFSDLTKKEKENLQLKDDFAHLKAENALLRKKLENNLRKNFAKLSKNYPKNDEKDTEKIK